MSDNNPTYLVLRYRVVRDERKENQHPRQEWRTKDHQSQEAQSRIRIAPTPDVDQRA